MQTKRDVQNRVLGYLREAGLSESELARTIGVPQATLNRMLRPDPSYRGSPDSWLRLARYAPLCLDPVRVLAAVGLGAAPAAPAVDPWALFEEAMRLWQLDEGRRLHLRRQVQYLLREEPASTF